MFYLEWLPTRLENVDRNNRNNYTREERIGRIWLNRDSNDPQGRNSSKSGSRMSVN